MRILGINHTVHPTIDDECQSQSKEDKKCNTSMLRTDKVPLAVDNLVLVHKGLDSGTRGFDLFSAGGGGEGESPSMVMHSETDNRATAM